MKKLCICLILIGIIGPIISAETIKYYSRDIKSYKEKNIKIIDTYENPSGVRSLILALDLTDKALRAQLYVYLFGFFMCGIGVSLLLRRKIILLKNEISELRNQKGVRRSLDEGRD